MSTEFEESISHDQTIVVHLTEAKVSVQDTDALGKALAKQAGQLVG
eukprot:CAMPEP_0206498978 /NCGR_PEP_ID=MMETSP0324_2-20121206/51395_1 /ASSEMBLY_ACC=CAM_ASM_000836 /TAXON_ID=2866 /ORGANISM="Crypthecodinium cohnii, Strain Seligo" /LENGTH=45 /DNA_ID= /DNA_START= /DNA_END= /DNA_ORIENTATION=